LYQFILQGFLKFRYIANLIIYMYYMTSYDYKIITIMKDSKPITLYKDNQHTVLMFPDLVTGHGVQANQFMIMDHGDSILLDPGGDLTYMPLTISVGQFMKTKDIKYIFASHQDPDIIASIDRWLMHTDCKVIISKLWGRFYLI